MIGVLEEIPMKIHLADYKEGVITDVREEYNPSQLDMEFVDLHYSKPLKMQGTVEKGLDTLTFRGHLTSETELVCGRCLKKESQSVDKPFEFFYEIKGIEDLDTTDDIRETLILEHSITHLCQENCRGLCPKCGTNLNETTCKCKPGETPLTGSLSDLKKIWSKRREE